jgi:hypothetical protein
MIGTEVDGCVHSQECTSTSYVEFRLRLGRETPTALQVGR